MVVAFTSPTGAPGSVVVLIPILVGIRWAVGLRRSVAGSEGWSDGRGRLAQARSRKRECAKCQANGESDTGEAESVREENMPAHA